MKEAVVEIYIEGQWHKAAEFAIYGENYLSGYHAAGRLSYDVDYVLAHMGSDRLVDRVGCLYPINFDLYSSNSWPAFLLDILPTGSARASWLKMLSLPDNESSWWDLLRFATGNPPGNLRIAGAAIEEKADHPGFDKQDIIEKNVDFIEYAESCGALVAGASDVQGQAPKFLLVEDRNGHWHAEGALPDEQVQRHWLVKFPRGKKEVDRQVLRNEAPYYEVARVFGLRTADSLVYQEDALFIRRFDRKVTDGRVDRLGLESMASVCGVSEFGFRSSHNEICKRINAFATDPFQEILEYINRDILNAALRNTDNHARNTAFLKDSAGTVALSPLFDFAPMFLDPEGIARASRWDGEGEKKTGVPDWGRVAEDLEKEIGISSAELRKWLFGQATKVKGLPETMDQCGVEASLIEKLIARIEDVTKMLHEARPKP